MSTARNHSAAKPSASPHNVSPQPRPFSHILIAILAICVIVASVGFGLSRMWAMGDDPQPKGPAINPNPMLGLDHIELGGDGPDHKHNPATPGTPATGLPAPAQSTVPQQDDRAAANFAQQEGSDAHPSRAGPARRRVKLSKVAPGGATCDWSTVLPDKWLDNLPDKPTERTIEFNPDPNSDAKCSIRAINRPLPGADRAPSAVADEDEGSTPGSGTRSAEPGANGDGPAAGSGTHPPTEPQEPNEPQESSVPEIRGAQFPERGADGDWVLTNFSENYLPAHAPSVVALPHPINWAQEDETLAIPSSHTMGALMQTMMHDQTQVVASRGRSRGLAFPGRRRRR